MSVERSNRTASTLTRDRLEMYRNLLVKWNASINLVGRNSMAETAQRHFSDSAQLLHLAPAGTRTWADLGTGGGFPGMVVAIEAADHRPGIHVTMIEADQRKAEFLRTVSRETGVDTTVLSARIEDVPPLHADVVSARALAPLTKLCGYAVRHGSEGGVALFMKGIHHQDEIAEARRRWEFDLEAISSATAPGSALLRMRHIRHV